MEGTPKPRNPSSLFLWLVKKEPSQCSQKNEGNRNLKQILICHTFPHWERPFVSAFMALHAPKLPCKTGFEASDGYQGSFEDLERHLRATV